MAKGKFIKRDSQSGKFIVGRKSMSKLNAMEGIPPSASSRAMFREFDRENASSEDRRKAIVAKHARKA